MNKKGIFQFIFGVGTVFAVFLAIILLIFLFAGGFETTYDISRLLSNIPAWAWVIIGFACLFMLVGGRRRR
jgi:hypothetical protein